MNSNYSDQIKICNPSIKNLPAWDLTARQLCDLEMLMTDAFAPLQGFLNQEDYESVIKTMRLSSGTLCPIPITLDVSATFANSLKIGQKIILQDDENISIAVMTIESIWQPDKQQEAEAIFATQDTRHLGVDYLLHRTESYYLGGRVEKVKNPVHYDFQQYRYTPHALKQQFKKQGWTRIIGYHNETVMHHAEHLLTARLAAKLEAKLLIQPIVGFSPSNTLDHFSRVRCYEQVVAEYSEQTPLLSLINLSSRMAGPREALWHMIVRKNYGCTHFIINAEHASPPQGSNNPTPEFYPPLAALTLAQQHAEEVGIQIIADEQMVYNQEREKYQPIKEIKAGETTLGFSESDFFRHLQYDLAIPKWFSYPAIIAEMKQACPPRHQQGFTLFFTGLSGSGKSTVANQVRIRLLELGGRSVTLLDGDIVRKNLSSELTFSKQHRDLNIRRIGFVASEITKHRGIAICAPIAPYLSMRREVREMIQAVGSYIEIHIATPLEECERRDRKGLYAKARAGLIQHFTGISDPYEEPINPEVRLDTTGKSVNDCADIIIHQLEELKFINS